MSATPPSQQNVRTAAGTRRYRSKSQRPCDLCRARKVLCNIPDPSQPCQLCERTGRPCTFVGNPNKKQRAASGARKTPSNTHQMDAFDDNAVGGASYLGDLHMHQDEAVIGDDDLNMMNDALQPSAASPNMGLPPLDSLIADTIWSCEGAEPWTLEMNHPDAASQIHPGEPFGIFQHQQLINSNSNPMHQELGNADTDHRSDSSTTERRTFAHLNVNRPPLDPKNDHCTQFIGYSNESDPFLLQRWPYNSVDEVDFFLVTYRNPAASAEPPVHFLRSKAGTASQARDLIDECMSLKDDRGQLEKLVDVEMGVTLVRLYLKFVFEALPILSRSQILQNEQKFIKTAPVGLLAAIYAIALPFTAWDEQLCLNNAYSKPSDSTLWQISYTCLQREIQFPRLSTIQLYILLLNHTPFDPVSVESPLMWSMAGSMLSIAQSLGLDIDPAAWKIPAWEVRLRRRLWWSVVVEHSWRAITHGRASLLHDEDWNVSCLTVDDFTVEQNQTSRNRELYRPSEYFLRICSLTQIANDICRKFFSLRAVTQPQILEDLLERARGPRQQLLEWLESLPESLHVLNDAGRETRDDTLQVHGSLHVAYYTAHVLVLRALLRPIIDPNNKLDHLQTSVGAVLQASRGLMQAMIKFVRGLDIRYQSAFWPAYTRHCFSYPGLFGYMLCLQRAESHMLLHDKNLLDTWRKTLRTRAQNWPLLRFGIVKIDALFWKKLDQISSSKEAASGAADT